MNADFKINGKIIETKRLIIRQFEQGDLDDFYEYASVDGVGQMAGWNPHENKEKSQEILNMFIEENKTFALFHRDDKKVIGSLGIEKYKRENELTEFNNYIGRELGFVLSKDYWGKGLMPEAVNAVINYLFNELNYDFLTSGYFIFNNQSKRVQEKCGFKPYRKLIIETRMGTKEDTILNLIINPNKNIKLNFSYPETLIYNN
ncbi:GNAT family N-acetyltransferase [Helcococcus ovis]|uniref:N-acetyltransferase n=4 Tax=Helcococcus ovis TaxID=72026 RepID=A0A4R9C284_9FIRM|nr:GNAT family N-acetyltransferase [Helcococcus ovis]TFF64588.1 N-acetyltransferase [Helcococcus ovis]TFF65398.1 N-acetyltransferase [Helcococcus ovis]TFF68454.1 N-acetyltransferase [Helcococcus ovis]WNZ00509.1 GNAT family N-acetyltransferase [Helcococcus ovis]